VLSGNCFAALGTLNGLTPARRAAFWFDAHGDYNTPETTTSGFIDGMGLAAATGLGWQRLAATVPGFQPMEGRNTFFLGVRDLDPPEASLVRETGATLVAVNELPAGLPRILERAMLADAVGYLHLDPDVLDPSVGRANYLPVPDGLSVSQLTGTIAAIRARVPIHAAGIASYSPEDDHDQGIARGVFTAIDAILASGDEAPLL
jgi:arginase